MRRIGLLLIGVLVCLAASAQLSEDEVFSAIKQMQERYPKITLCDIYKSFYQDRFGPGHIIESKEKAEGYLMKEMKNTEELSVEIEPTGAKGNFVRVDIFFIQMGLIDKDAYIKHLMNSVVETDSTDIRQWLMDWNYVIKVIERRGLKIENYKEDMEFIRQRMENGIYEMNHSEQFNKLYHPHYRIFRRDVYEQNIKPLIK